MARSPLVRLDVAIGVLAAIILLIISPGLASRGSSLFVLLAVFVSIAVERRRTCPGKRSERSERLAARRSAAL